MSHQGEKARELSQKRQDLWLAQIHKSDLGPEKYPNTWTLQPAFSLKDSIGLYQLL